MKWFLFLNILTILIFIESGVTGSYKESAHGNSTYGVKRSSIDYVKGNCGHCHEMHASIHGEEPAPAGSIGSFALFANNFNTAKIIGPYEQNDNFCFYCHCGDDAIILQNPAFYNYNYSRTFGGYSNSTINSIFEAFNQASYHNLYDIWNFAKDYFSSFFTLDSNPCVACHNPHIAKRKYAISKPTAHANLWGDTNNETMGKYAIYQPPYCWNFNNLEPDCSNLDRITQAFKTPDYVTFCQDCHHRYYPPPYSSILDRALKDINWGTSVHGKIDSWKKCDTEERKAPYNTAEANYILSCTDCHEPHGSPNFKYLIRREVNGDIVIINLDNDWDSLCLKCHNTNHYSNETCIECHYHGATDNETGNPIF